MKRLYALKVAQKSYKAFDPLQTEKLPIPQTCTARSCLENMWVSTASRHGARMSVVEQPLAAAMSSIALLAVERTVCL